MDQLASIWNSNEEFEADDYFTLDVTPAGVAGQNWELVVSIS